MSLNYILSWIVGISAGAGLLAMLIRFRGRQRGWLVVCGVTLATLTFGLWFFPGTAGYPAGAVWTFFFIVPLWGQRRVQRLVARQQYRAACRLARALAVLHPADDWREQPGFLEVLDELHHGDVERARRRLDTLSPGSSRLARFARLQLFRFEGRWLEARAWIEQHIPHDDLVQDPQSLVFYLRVLGEVGEPATMLQAFSEVANRPTAEQARVQISFLLFALGGRGQALEGLFAGPMRHLPEPVQRFWRATACQVAGRRDEARALFTTLLEAEDRLLRRASERRLESPLPPLDEGGLPVDLVSMLNDLERRVADIARYGTLAQPRRGHNWMSWIMLTALAMVFAVEVPGGTTSSENLARLGALLISPEISGEWWRVITAAFLHYGAVHFALNALALWYLGRYLERVWGPTVMAAAFLIPAVLANTGAVLLLSGPNLALVGASGGVMGVIGTLMALVAVEWRRTGVVLLRRQLWFLGTIVLLQVLFDVFTPRVSSTIHVLGFLVGGLLGLIFARVLRPRRADLEPGRTDQPMESPPK